jgi:murein DD-endopeptidase MepM/ murein hydrolase activator NlpD
MQVDMHHKRRLLIALVAASGMSAGLGSFAVVANAAQRTFVITVVGHLKKTITLDVGQNVPLDQIKLPSILGLPILSIQEITPPQAPAPAAAPTTTAPAPTAPDVTADPTAPPVDQASGTDRAQSQRTTGTTKRVPHPGERALDTAGHVIGDVITKVERARPQRTPLRLADGVPTLQNPTMSLALPGPVAVGVPNFFINKFRIPVFLLPIYQAAGIQYGVPWEVLSAINEIETDYGRNLNVSSAGAVGWMQFLMSSWKIYGVDANGDGKKDPYNPVDAIFAAARYLKAAGAEQDLRKAIFTYNHADWYVNSVLMRARFIGGMPADLVGSLSGLTQGRFPVHAEARYADDISERATIRRVARGHNAALPVEANTSRRGINIYAKAGSPVIAVQDGRIVKVGNNDRLGNFVVLRDVYGNSYTYAGLKKVARQVPVPKPKTQSKASIAKELALPRDAKPAAPASAGKNVGKATKAKTAKKVVTTATATRRAAVAKERLFANPTRPKALSAGGKRQLLESESTLADGASFKSYFSGVYGLKRDDVVLKRLVPGRRVIAGTILGRIGKTSSVLAPHVLFEIRPAGRGAPRIDPQPILDGWKVLEATAIYRAQGKNAFFGDNAQGATIGQILLMSKEALAQRVLSNPRIDLYSCGRRDIEAGIIDRRVLATLEFLAASGLKPSVTSLECGHGYYTAGGNVSAHSSGNAVDIAKINGIPILGNQGPGSITDITIRRLLTLQGTMKPAQIISLMTYDGTDNTLALPDHNDHIHVGYRPQFDSTTKAGKIAESVLKPSQWVKLIDRLGQIDNPTVQVKPSKYAIKAAPGRASEAHVAE